MKDQTGLEHDESEIFIIFSSIFPPD